MVAGVGLSTKASSACLIENTFGAFLSAPRFANLRLRQAKLVCRMFSLTNQEESPSLRTGVLLGCPSTPTLEPYLFRDSTVEALIGYSTSIIQHSRPPLEHVLAVSFAAVPFFNGGRYLLYFYSLALEDPLFDQLLYQIVYLYGYCLERPALHDGRRS